MEELFFRILEKLGERSVLVRRAVRAARADFHSHARSQHSMWSSPRSRARFNRACVRRALASLSTTAMTFVQRGGVNPAEADHSRRWRGPALFAPRIRRAALLR